MIGLTQLRYLRGYFVFVLRIRVFCEMVEDCLILKRSLLDITLWMD